MWNERVWVGVRVQVKRGRAEGCRRETMDM